MVLASAVPLTAPHAALVPETIAAGRFVLRPIRLSDAEPFALYCGEDRVAMGTRSIPHPLPQDYAANHIAAVTAPNASGKVWVMDGTCSGMSEFLGVLSLDPLGEAQSEVGYWVAPPYWNAGIASDAVRALIGANPFGDRTMFAEVFQDNPGSARVLTNAGFQYLGDAETVCVSRGETVPTWTYLRKLA